MEVLKLIKVFKVSTIYDTDYEARYFEFKCLAQNKDEALQKFLNNCQENISQLRRFLSYHPKLEGKLIHKIDYNYNSFEGYYDLTYVRNEHTTTYEEYLGYDKESSWFTPKEKTDENYQEYLEYKKYWQSAYEKLTEFKNDLMKIKEYEDYVKEEKDEIDEANKKLLTDEFIYDFFKELETHVSEIELNKLDIRVVNLV